MLHFAQHCFDIYPCWYMQLLFICFISDYCITFYCMNISQSIHSAMDEYLNCFQFWISVITNEVKWLSTFVDHLVFLFCEWTVQIFAYFLLAYLPFSYWFVRVVHMPGTNSVSYIYYKWLCPTYGLPLYLWYAIHRCFEFSCQIGQCFMLSGCVLFNNPSLP